MKTRTIILKFENKSVFQENLNSCFNVFPDISLNLNEILFRINSLRLGGLHISLCIYDKYLFFLVNLVFYTGQNRYIALNKITFS